MKKKILILIKFILIYYIKGEFQRGYLIFKGNKSRVNVPIISEQSSIYAVIYPIQQVARDIEFWTRPSISPFFAAWKFVLLCRYMYIGHNE